MREIEWGAFQVIDGQVRECSDYAPYCWADNDGEHIESDEWEWWSRGYSGQWGYSGPVMHTSETLSGGMLDDLLANDGTYALVTVEHEECFDDDAGSHCDETCDHEPVGWAVLKRVSP